MKTKNKGKPFRQTLIENEITERGNKLRALLDNPAIRKTNNGYEIDLIELYKQLSQQKKKEFSRFILT